MAVLMEKESTKQEKRGRRTVTVPAVVWSVRFTDSNGRDRQTNWTTYKGEAEGWKDQIEKIGHQPVAAGSYAYEPGQSHQRIRFI